MPPIRSLSIAVVFTVSATAYGQPVTIGAVGVPTGDFGPGPQTVIMLSSPTETDS